MILLDVNVLVAAHREDHLHHPSVRPWFDALLGCERPFAVPGAVWAAFVRIVTNRRIFTIPTPLADAFTFVRATRAQPGHVGLSSSTETLDLFESTCRGADAVGDLVADAYLASIAIEHGATLVSLDRDFARFVDLRWELPGAPASD